MSMNKFMHPRNIYKTPPNFKELALQFPEFRKHIKLDISGKVTFDFKDPDSLRALCKTLLKKDFNLDVEIPKTKLVPTIPLRLNYILWIEDLLEFLHRSQGIKGIDIGTGASCIYPLLAAKKNGWHMLATEADQDSFQYAQTNVKKNNLQDLITVTHVTDDSLLTGHIQNEDYDFCMCNPPFFASTQELHPFFKSRNPNRPRPKNAFVANVNEVVAKGGEVEFINKIIKESQVLKTRIKLYTTMVGQKSDLPALKKLLRDAGVHSFKEAEFCQGNTTRWGLAWTYIDCDLRKMADQVKLAVKPVKTHPPLLYPVPGQENCPENVAKVVNVFLKMFKNLKMSFEDVGRNKLHPRYFVTASSNTWSNQRRRRREMLKKTSGEGTPENNNSIEKQEETEELKAVGKRNLDDILCESTSKKLRLSTDSETSEPNGVFFKFMFAITCLDDKVIAELNTLDEIGDRECLHQIMQYVKNNFGKALKELYPFLVCYCHEIHPHFSFFHI